LIIDRLIIDRLCSSIQPVFKQTVNPDFFSQAVIEIQVKKPEHTMSSHFPHVNTAHMFSVENALTN
jgi:hypothetical protein